MTRLPAELRRERLVRAALAVIAREGVHGATTRAIVAEAGMSLASFHYVFPSRDRLIQEVIAFVLRDQERVSMVSLRRAGSPRQAIHRGVSAYFELLKRDPERELAMAELMHYAMRNPDFGSLPRIQHASYRATARTLLEAGAAEFGFTWSRPVDELARLLVVQLDGLTVAWLADRDDAAAELVIDFIADTLAVMTIPATLEVAQ
jgi:AcrR family transcriptional regulator